MKISRYVRKTGAKAPSAKETATFNMHSDHLHEAGVAERLLRESKGFWWHAGCLYRRLACCGDGVGEQALSGRRDGVVLAHCSEHSIELRFRHIKRQRYIATALVGFLWPPLSWKFSW